MYHTPRKLLAMVYDIIPFSSFQDLSIDPQAKEDKVSNEDTSLQET